MITSISDLPPDHIANIPDPQPWPDELAARADDPPEADEADSELTAGILAIRRLLEILWSSGSPGGDPNKPRPRRPLGADRLHVSVQRAATRLTVLSWMIAPQAVCRDTITLSDIAGVLGVTRALTSNTHVELGRLLNGMRGATGRSDAGRAAARAARYRALESGSGRGIKDGPGPAGDSFQQRDRTDEGAARRGLAKLARPHLTDLDRRGQHAQTNDNITHVERHALRRRGWIGADDVLTEAGVEALAELRMETE